jgi:hypothetical protein
MRHPYRYALKLDVPELKATVIMAGEKTLPVSIAVRVCWERYFTSSCERYYSSCSRSMCYAQCSISADSCDSVWAFTLTCALRGSHARKRITQLREALALR